MDKKLAVPKDYNEICQNCGKTYGAHFGFNCKDGGKWIPPVSDYPKYIAPKSLMNKPQQLDEALKIVETVLKALKHTTNDFSKIGAIAAVRFVTNITLVEAKDIVDTWAKKNKWWDEKPAHNYPKHTIWPIYHNSSSILPMKKKSHF